MAKETAQTKTATDSVQDDNHRDRLLALNIALKAMITAAGALKAFH